MWKGGGGVNRQAWWKAKTDERAQESALTKKKEEKIENCIYFRDVIL